MTNHALRLYLCGPFRIEGEGEETTRLRTRKTESVLAFMALTRGAWVTRETLISEFWPCEAATDAKPKLRLALHSIRRAIGNRLESRGESVRLVDVWVDALDADPADLVSAQILTGRFEDWLVPFQMTLDRRVEASCLRAFKAADSADEKISGLLALLRVEPANADYHAALFNLLEGLQNRAAARAAARNAVRVLGRDCPDALRAAAKSQETGPQAQSLVLAQLAHLLLGQDEPAVVTLIGPAGIGKTYAARQLIRLAKEDELEVLFLSLVDRSSVSAVFPQAGDPQLLADLPPTLLVLDNAEDVPDSAFEFLASRAFQESSLRVLITSQRSVTPTGMSLRMPAKSLPASSESADLIGSETALLIAREMDLEVEEIDAESLFRACHGTGGLPLAIKLVARDLQLGDMEARGESGNLHLRLKKAHSRLEPTLAASLEQLLPLQPAFHAGFAELVGVDRETLRLLHERCWIEPTGELGVFEILPPIRRFLQEQGVRKLPPTDLVGIAVERSDHLIETNYLNLIREYLPSIATVEELLDQLILEGDFTRASRLYSSLYFCYQRIENVERPVEIGLRIFGPDPGPRWELGSAGLNAFASACFFAKRHDLAENAYRFLAAGPDLHYASIGLTNLGLIALNRGDSAEAIDLIERSLDNHNLKPRQLVARLNNLAKSYAVAGRFEEAIVTAEQAVRLCGEEEELSLMKAVLFFSLAETHFMAGSREEALDWARRALRAFSLTGEKLRILESACLLGYLQAVSDHREEATSTIQDALPRLAFAARHWAANAACLLNALGATVEAAELSSGLEIKSQPNWVQHVLGESASAVSRNVPLTNSERFAIFRQAMKRV